MLTKYINSAKQNPKPAIFTSLIFVAVVIVFILLSLSREKADFLARVLHIKITNGTFEEVLNKEPAKEVSVTAVFTRSISLEEAKNAVKDIPFVVKGIQFNAGESNGGCGVEDGKTIIQALDNCASEHSLFLQRRIDMEKNTLSTATDPGLQKAFVAHIAEAEKAQNIQFTAFELYGKAVDIQHFKEDNIFVEKIEIMSQGTSSPSIQSGVQTPVMVPSSFSIPAPSLSPAR